MENRPLEKFIRNYIRDSSGVFSISSLVGDINDVISFFYTVVCAKIRSISIGNHTVSSSIWN